MPYIDSINIRAKDSTENEEEIQRFDDKLKVALYIYDADSGTYIALDKSHLMSIDGDVYVKVDDLEDLTSDVITELQVLNSLVPSAYDYIALTYTGSNLTGVVFKTGGSGGTTVSTLTLAYTGSQLDSVTKT